MFTVYMHVTPSNKRYIGITSKNVAERFGTNGCLYRNQIFGRAIKKYGWSNIEHIILAENLTEEDAKNLEIDMIAKYDTTNPKYGYNQSIGGDVPVILGKQHSEETKKKIRESNLGKEVPIETRQKISAKVKSIWKTNEYRKKQEQRVVSDVTRERMSNSHKGKVLSDEHKEKIKVSNVGKHNYGAETKKLLSDIVRKQHKKERELGIKRNYSNTTSKAGGTKWYNNGIKNIRSKDGCPEGYVPGRLHYDYPKNRKSRKRSIPSEDDAEPAHRTERKVREVKKQFSGDKEDVF